MPLVALREAALAAVAARLSAQMPDVVVERARRAPVDVEVETLPRLVLLGGALTADAQVEPGSIHYGVEFSVTGWVAAATDLATEQALSALHARVVEALVRWTPLEGRGELFAEDVDTSCPWQFANFRVA